MGVRPANGSGLDFGGDDSRTTRTTLDGSKARRVSSNRHEYHAEYTTAELRDKEKPKKDEPAGRTRSVPALPGRHPLPLSLLLSAAAGLCYNSPRSLFHLPCTPSPILQGLIAT